MCESSESIGFHVTISLSVCAVCLLQMQSDHSLLEEVTTLLEPSAKNLHVGGLTGLNDVFNAISF
jgi:hypothetical protein